VSFKIIMTAIVTRSHFTKQHQNCKTKAKTAVCKTKTVRSLYLVRLWVSGYYWWC